MQRLIARLRGDIAGVSAVEFALILPILIALAYGTIEYGRMLLLSQKLQNGTFILADLTARGKTVSVAELDNILLAIDNVMQPFDFGGHGIAIVSSVRVDGAGDATVNWQRSSAGDFEHDSLIGEGAGEEAALPEDLPVGEDETVIVAEVFFEFEPLFPGLMADDHVLRRVAYVRPRLGTLETLRP